jgi:hypothetical protein
MSRSIAPLLALLALGCSQDPAPPAEAPPVAPVAEAPAPPDRTATEAVDADAVKEPTATELPSFEGDHAMAKADAAKVSLAWLALVDAGDYAGSWEAAASLLQDAAPKEPFAEKLGATLGPFGAVKSRSFSAAEYSKALPGAPDGEYVVIQYDTVFENKAEAVETITPMIDWDGTWKVSGYYVK